MPRLPAWLRSHKLASYVEATTARIRHNNRVYEYQAALARESLEDLKAKLAAIDAAYPKDGSREVLHARATETLRILDEDSVTQELRTAAARKLLL